MVTVLEGGFQPLMYLHHSRSIRLLLVLATAALLFSVPTLAAAAGKPRGTTATLEIAPRLSLVSVGGNAGFEVTLTNGGNGTLTHPRFTGTAPGGDFVSGSPGCTGAGPEVTCTFGKLASGRSIVFTVVFETAAAGELTLDGTMRVDSGRNNQNATSKDTFTATSSVDVTASPEYFGSWQPAHGGSMTYATGGTGSGNGQSTSVTVPPVGVAYPAILAESNEPMICNGEVVEGFGQIVDLSIANGDPVSPHLTLTLTYKKSAIGWIDADDVLFVHQDDEGNCSYPPRGCTWANDGFCFDAKWKGHGSSKKLVITVELPHNGRGRGV